jgi:hypothetical protein
VLEDRDGGFAAALVGAVAGDVLAVLLVLHRDLRWRRHLRRELFGGGRSGLTGFLVGIALSALPLVRGVRRRRFVIDHVVAWVMRDEGTVRNFRRRWWRERCGDGVDGATCLADRWGDG